MKIYKKILIEKIKISTWLLALYLILAPLDFMPVIPGVSLSKMLIIIPLIGYVFYVRDIKIIIDRYFIISVLYVILIMISLLYSYDPSATMQRIITISLNVGVTLVLSTLEYNNTEIKIIKRSIVLSGWFTLLLMIIYSSFHIDGRLTVSINGTYQDPNYLTGFLLFAIIYYLDDFIDKKRITSIIKLIIFLAFVMLTGSRGGTIAILGAMLFYLLAFVKSNRIKISSIIFIFVFVLIAIVSFKLIINLLPDYITNRYTLSFTIEDGGANRFDIWKTILDNFESTTIFHKFFGMGAGTISHFSLHGKSAHNIWIESMMEIGIIGTIIFFIYYFKHLFKAYKMREYVVFATFIGYIIMGMSMSLSSYKPIWNIILLILILKNGNARQLIT